jgi:hypothetical protein
MPVAPVTLRPRSTTELIDAAVQLFRQHYTQLAAATALYMIPIIVAVVATASIWPSLDATEVPAITSLQLAAIPLTALLVVVSLSMSTATVVVIVSESYLGRPITIGAAANRVFARFWAIMGVAILQPLVIGLGFLLFIVGMLVFQAWYFAPTYVVMIEGTGTLSAFSRSHTLARGSVGRILGAILLVGFIVGFVQSLIGVALSVVVAVFHTNSVGVALLPYVLAGIFVYPLKTTVMTLLYYDLRIRKEGFDLALASSALTPAAVAPTSHSPTIPPG